jgi:hypothetical protein
VHVEFEFIPKPQILVSVALLAQSAWTLSAVEVWGYKITRDPMATAIITAARIMFHFLIGDK